MQRTEVTPRHNPGNTAGAHTAATAAQPKVILMTTLKNFLLANESAQAALDKIVARELKAALRDQADEHKVTVTELKTQLKTVKAEAASNKKMILAGLKFLAEPYADAEATLKRAVSKVLAEAAKVVRNPTGL